MNEWTPGSEWREVDAVTATQANTDSIVHYAPGDGKGVWWVREDPVPPLPIEPYTVIRVTWRDDSSRPTLGDLGIRTLFPDGTWTGWAVPNLLERITGFKVLAEPVREYEEVGAAMQRVRRETAKALVARYYEWSGLTPGESDELDAIAREFGVES